MEQLIHRLCFVIDKFCRFDKHSSCPRMYSYGEYPEVYEMMMRSYGTKLFLSPNRKKVSFPLHRRLVSSTMQKQY